MRSGPSAFSRCPPARGASVQAAQVRVRRSKHNFSRMRIGFLMDPLDEVRVDHDSTFALMLECQRRGLEVLELRQEWLYVSEGRTRSRMRTVRVQRKPGAHFRVLGDSDRRAFGGIGGRCSLFAAQ